jgi:tellurite resistance protein TehA-like permease
VAVRRSGWSIRQWVATLDPIWFAWVMATGIVSVGAEELGFHALSLVALVVTTIVYAVLLAAYLVRAFIAPAHLRTSVSDPRMATGSLTLVAGTNVLAIRLVMADHPLAVVVLGTGAALIGVVLTYAAPLAVVAGRRRPVLRDVNASWLLWVVAVQSVAIVAADLASVAPWSPLRHGLPPVAVTLWSVGVMLYLIVIVAIISRVLIVEMTPSEMSPAYWIAMGAAGICITAATGILGVHDPSATPLVNEMHPILVGSSVVLWAFGTWLIPFLVMFGVWRHVVRGYPLSFEPDLWSVVFPLGMYTVASVSLGRAANLGFMVAVARVWLWVGVVAWVAVLALMLSALWRSFLGRPASS